MEPTPSSSTNGHQPPATSSYPQLPGQLPAWVKQVSNLSLAESSKANIERAKSYAKDMKPILLHSITSGDPVPDIPPGLLSTNPFFNSDIDPSTLDNLSNVYIGSINFDLNEDHIRAIFAQYGAIKALSMSIDPVVGHHKGFCFLEYETPEGGDMAVEALNGAQLGGRSLRVGRPNHYNPGLIATLPPPPPGRLYVANVNEFVSEANVASIFEPFGTPVKCVLIPDVLRRKHKGYGYIEFGDAQASQMALAAMNGFDLGGMPLRIRKAVVGGPLPEGMSALDRVPELNLSPEALGAARGTTASGTTPATVVPTLLMPAAAPPSLSMGSSANAVAVSNQGWGGNGSVDSATAGGSQLSNGSAAPYGQPPQQQQQDSVAKEENMSIDANQRYSLMKRLAQRGVSTVVCIANAVGLEEVDDELQEEFAQECSNFGQVVKVVVHTTPSDPLPERQVKIFVQFTDATGSQTALAALNGRWFGGRQLSAWLYDQDKFYAGNYSA